MSDPPDCCLSDSLDPGVPALTPVSAQGSQSTDEDEVAVCPQKRRHLNDGSPMPVIVEEHKAPEVPTKFLNLKNLSAAVQSSDIESLFSPFTTSQPLRIHSFSGGHALISLGTFEEAEDACEYLKNRPPNLKGQTVSVELASPPSGEDPPKSSPTIQAARSQSTPQQPAPNPPAPPSSGRVLLTSVTNIVYPVDIELLRFLFSRFGVVEKIVTFNKAPGTFNAFVQMADVSQAQQALRTLHHRNIYDNCNTLQIQTSKLNELTVKANSARAWNYIAPSPEALISASSSSQPHYTSDQAVGVIQRWDPRQLEDYASSSAENLPPTLNRPAAPPALPPSHLPPGATATPGAQSPGFQKVLGLSRLSKEMKEWRSALSFSTATPTNVIIVYNITPEVVTASELFNVFSLYGVLLRIKILREKPHTALLQYADPVYASLAAHFLQGAALFDENPGLQIGFSRNAEVKLSHTVSPENMKRTRAFGNSDQRYSAHEVEKFVKSACSPTTTLFIANPRDEIDEPAVMEAVSKYGTVNKIQLKAPNEGGKNRFALVEMASRNEALTALAYLHNTQLKGSTIKVAFSKIVIPVEDCAK